MIKDLSWSSLEHCKNHRATEWRKEQGYSESVCHENAAAAPYKIVVR